MNVGRNIDRGDPSDPPRLAGIKGNAAALLNEYARRTQPVPTDDRAAWRALEQRLDPPATAPRLLWSKAALASGLLVAAVGVCLLAPARRAPDGERAEAPAADYKGQRAGHLGPAGAGGSGGTSGTGGIKGTGGAVSPRGGGGPGGGGGQASIGESPAINRLPAGSNCACVAQGCGPSSSV